MDKPLVSIMYKTADGKRIRLEVTSDVAELLEQSERQIRSQKRQDRRYLVAEEYEDGVCDTTSLYPHEDFADLLIRMDSYERLYSAMKKLSEKQERRLRLRYFRGLTFRQIAETERVSRKTVEDSVTSAVKRLREILQSDC